MHDLLGDGTRQHNMVRLRVAIHRPHFTVRCLLLAACCLLLAACCLLLAACCLLLAVKRKTSRNLNAPSAKRCHPPVAPPGLAQCRAGCPTPLLAPQYSKCPKC